MAIDLKELRTDKKKLPARDNATKASGSMSAIEALMKKDLFVSETLGAKQKARFYSEIAILLSAGVDLHTILMIASSSNKNPRLATLYKSLSQAIIQGSNLSDAMRSSKQFNNFDCYSVLIGENTGDIANVFTRLSEYYNKRIAQQRKIKGALSYPLIVLLTTVGAVFFMLKFVVPMFAQTLIRFGGELPRLTSIVIELSEHITTYLLIVAAAVGVAYGIWYRNKDNEAFRNNLSNMVLKTPYIGKFVYKANILEFTLSMNLLLNSKVNIVESIDLVQKISTFYPLKKSLAAIKADILKGDFFYASMEKQHFFDHSMVTLVKIGEEVNQLDKIFVQLSKQYEDELEYQSSVIMSVLEPVIILVLALIVGVILVAMYLPMFKMGTIIH